MPPMFRRRVIQTLALALLSACGDGGGEDQGIPDGPNVILISIDSLRADHVGCYGYKRQTTPNLDQFAREGARFAQHVSSSSWTLPAHAAMFTSTVDSVHGCVEATGTALNPGFTTLAERFQDAGYATGGFYGGPYLHEVFGLGQGFDEYVYCDKSNREVFPGDKVEAWSNNPNNHARSHDGVTNEAVYGAAREFMAGTGKRPFFAFVHLWDVHYDFTPPPPWETHFNPGYTGPVDGAGFSRNDQRYAPGMAAADFEQLVALYDGEIGWTDTFLGKLREDLERWGVKDDTVVAITSDHGTEFFEHGTKGHRQTVFDEVVHVPFVLWGPGRVPSGTVVEDQTRAIDLAPTLLELADLAQLDTGMGHSLVPATRSGRVEFANAAVSELYSIGFELRAVRVEGGKFLTDERDGAPSPERWYDLGVDPGEQAASTEFKSGRGAELRQQYLQTLADVERAISRRPGGAVAADLTDEIRRALDANGYLKGGDEEE